ncbi:uncharacterized protein LOC128271169 [Anopheles cruzii]|uniref:uncharacterized protein LOC128271169 n=1 Tax=Anopheles cruzii TaxID=68878 RepID=UPI0022EC2A72|nr:uncharacterized protein LOC128271169 [Anopheles cruzii]
MPLLVAPSSTHGVALVDPGRAPTNAYELVPQESHHTPRSRPEVCVAVDFTMSKFKASSRHSLYRQFYGADESPPYEKPDETDAAEPEGREKSFGKGWLNNEAQWNYPGLALGTIPGQPPGPIVSGSSVPPAPPPPPPHLSMASLGVGPPPSAPAMHPPPPQQPPFHLNPTSLMSLREMMLQSPAGLSLLGADASSGLGLLKRTMLDALPSGSSAAAAGFPPGVGINPLPASSCLSATATTTTYSLPSMIPTSVASLSAHQRPHRQQIKKERDESEPEPDDGKDDEDDEKPMAAKQRRPDRHPSPLRPPHSISPFHRGSPPPPSTMAASVYYHRASTASHQPHLYHQPGGGGHPVTATTVAAALSHQRQHQRDSAERELNLNANTVRARNERELLQQYPGNYAQRQVLDTSGVLFALGRPDAA